MCMYTYFVQTHSHAYIYTCKILLILTITHYTYLLCWKRTWEKLGAQRNKKNEILPSQGILGMVKYRQKILD